MPSRRVVMYSRKACHLCDQAREVILAVRSTNPFAFEEVSIDGDDDLERAYGLRVPVVEIDGDPVFEFAVEPSRLAELVRP